MALLDVPTGQSAKGGNEMDMTDHEKRMKIIKGLECCDALHNGGKVQCVTACPYWRGTDGKVDNCCRGLLIRDALAVMKMQEQQSTTSDATDKRDIAACPIHDTHPRTGMGYEYYDWCCPNCKAYLAPEPAVDKIPRRCLSCGQLLTKPQTR